MNTAFGGGDLTAFAGRDGTDYIAARNIDTSC